MTTSFEAVYERLLDVSQSKTDAALAQALGVTAQSVSQAKKKRQIPSQWILRLAGRYGASADWLLYGKAEGGEAESASHVKTPGKDRSIPVIGLASCSLSGWFNPSPLALSINTPMFADAEEVFAVVAVGASMQPAGIRQGNVLFCDPRISPDPNSPLYIEKKSGEASVKLYVKEDDKWLTVQGWMDPDAEGAQKPYNEMVAKATIRRMAPVVMVKYRA